MTAIAIDKRNIAHHGEVLVKVSESFMNKTDRELGKWLREKQRRSAQENKRPFESLTIA